MKKHCMNCQFLFYREYCVNYDSINKEGKKENKTPKEEIIKRFPNGCEEFKPNFDIYMGYEEEYK